MEIKAQKREITGKKVKNIRSKGMVPASVYGPGKKAENVMVDALELKKAYKEVGQSKFLTLAVEGEEPVQILIKDIQTHPVTDEMLNVSFYEIDKTKKITASVPIEFTGISPAVKNNIGFLVTPFTNINLRCLPKDLPEKIVLDISNLNEIGDSITLDTLKLGESVEFAGSVDTKSSIVYIAPPQKEIVEEVKPVEVEEGAEGAEAAEGAEGTEGAAAVEGEAKTDEAKKE
jgi:large subunit ribosomal protein L25